MFKKTKWILPPLAIGITSVVAFQVVSCGASSKKESIKLNSMSFSSVAELSEWAKNNLNTSDVNKTKQWSIFNGEKNIYFNSPLEVKEYIEKNNIHIEKSYLSESINSHLDTTDGLGGRIMNYPLSDNVKSIQTAYEGIDGVRYLELDEAVSSLLQIHNAYLFDNKYFLNKEALNWYLEQKKGDPNYFTHLATNTEERFQAINDGKSYYSDAISTADTDAIKTTKVNNFVNLASQRGVMSNGQFIAINKPEALQSVSDIPYIIMNDNGKASYVLDLQKDVTGSLFAPYVFSSEASPVGQVNNSAQWTESDKSMENAKSSNYIGSLLNSAYGFIFDDVNIDKFSDLLKGGFVNELVDKSRGTNTPLGTEFENYLKNSSQTIKDLEDTFKSFNDLFDKAFTGENNESALASLSHFEDSLKMGKRYGVLTSLPLLRGRLMDIFLKNEASKDERKSNKWFDDINKTFDFALKYIDFRAHKMFDEISTDQAKQFNLAKLFSFDKEKKMFIGTDFYLQKILDGQDARNNDNKGGVELALSANFMFGANSLIMEQRTFLNSAISKRSELTPEQISKMMYQIPTSILEINAKVNEFNSFQNLFTPLHFSSVQLQSVDLEPSKKLLDQANQLQSFINSNQVTYNIDKTDFDDKLNAYLQKLNLTFSNSKYEFELPMSPQAELSSIITDDMIREAEKEAHDNGGLDVSFLSEMKFAFERGNAEANKVLDTLERMMKLNLTKTNAIKDAILNHLGFTGVSTAKELESVFTTDNRILKGITSIEGFTKFAKVATTIAKGLKFVSIFGMAAAVGLDLIFNAIIGQKESDTYEWNSGSGDTFYWNGGSHVDHSFFGIHLATTDKVGPEAMRWVDIAKVSEATALRYYAFGKYWDSEDEIKQEYLRRIIVGDESVSNVIEYQIELKGPNGNTQILKDDSLEKLVSQVIAQQQCLNTIIVTDEGPKVDATAAAENIIAKILANIKPLWIAQLPERNSNGIFIHNNFMLPVSTNDQLFDYKGNITTNNNKYYIYDQNIENTTNGSQKTSDFKSVEDIKNMFIEMYKRDNIIQSKQVLMIDALRISEFSKLPKLLGVDERGNTSPLNIYVASALGNKTESFIDKGSALSWALSQLSFTIWNLNPDDKWYLFEDKKFLSITEFVNWVLQQNKGVN